MIQYLQKIRQPFNGLSHLAGAVFSLFGLIFLLIKGWDDPTRIAAYVVYGISLTLMFSASAAYHIVNADDQRLLLLRKLDHTAIYLLIAGTYTPICLLFFEGFWQWGLLAIVWGFALIGIIVKLLIINAPRWVTAGIYLVMGWLCIMAVGEMIRSMPLAALTGLAAGGLFYTIGAVVYITKKMDFIPGRFGFHEVWHIFVILGAFTHFWVIAIFSV